MRYCSDIIIDKCVLEDFVGTAIRVIGSECTIQRCVFRNAVQVAGQDSTAINVSPQGEDTISNTKILDNEIYNMVDCLASNVASNPVMHLQRYLAL